MDQEHVQDAFTLNPSFFVSSWMLTFILSTVPGQGEFEIKQQVDHINSYSQLPIPCI